MDQLRKQFEQALAALDQARGKLGHGEFLSDEEQSGLLSSLDALLKEQSRVRELLGGEDGAPVRSLQDAQRMLEQREAAELRRLVERFRQLEPLEPTYQEALAKYQRKLAEAGGQELLELERTGALEPYRRFLNCVEMERPGYEDISPLIAVFGTALPLGILGGKIRLGGTEKEAGNTQTPDVPGASEDDAEAETAAGAMESDEEDAEETEEEEEPENEEDEDEEDEEDEEEEEEVPPPPLTDSGLLGKLEIQESRKQPKGVKALTSLLISSPVCLHIAFELYYSRWLLVPDAPIFMTAEDTLSSAAQDKCLAALMKDGYLSRCFLEDDPERPFYFVPEACRQIFKKTVEKMLRTMKKRPQEISTFRMETAADYLRCYEGRRWFTRTFGIPGILGLFSEITGATMITLAQGEAKDEEDEGGPAKAVILPSLLYTEDDPETAAEELREHLRETLETAAGGCKIFLAVYDEADAEGWRACLGSCLPKDGELFWGVMGQDLYRGEDGTELSLSDYLAELKGKGGASAESKTKAKAKLKTASRAKAASKAASKTEASSAVHRHTPGKPVREVIQEATCTEEGVCEDVVSCADCGEELSRQRGVLPKKPHTPGESVQEVIREATCAKAGVCEEVTFCADCGAEISRKRDALPKTPHTPGRTVRKTLREASCTEEGVYEEVLVCRDCGGEISRDTGVLPKTEHIPGPPVRENIKEPSTKEAGSYEEVVSCTACGVEISRRVRTIPALASTEENQLLEMHRNMYGLFAERKFPSALAMSRALSRRREDLGREYLQIAYAMDDPALEKKRCCYSELQAVFPGGFGQDLAEDALGLAAYLRLFFSSDAVPEAYYLGDVMGTLNQNRMFQLVPELKNIFFSLSDCYKRTRSLMTPETLSQLVDNRRTSSLREQYQKEAGRFLAGKPEESQQMNKRVNNTFRELFGSKSQNRLRLVAEWVRDGQEDKAEEIRALLKGFLAGGEPLTGVCEDKHLDRDSLERFVQSAWESTKDQVAKNRNENFRDPARSTAISRLAELTKLAMSWVVLGAGGSDDVSGDVRSFLDTQRRVIAGKMREAADLCGQCRANRPEEEAAFSVLVETLHTLSGFLREGRSVNDQKYFYLEFLRDNRIEVGDDGIPCLEEDFEEIAPLNLCKRILKHSQSELPPWPDVIKRIFEEPEEGCDFGHAELIRNYLLAFEEGFVWPETYSFEQSIKAALQRMDEEGRKFQAQLDLAENYGWIDDTSRIDRILADMEKRREHYLSTQNFGFYFRTTEACKEALKREAEHHKDGYTAELNRLKAEKGNWPIFKEVQRLISEQMYTVAQDYMDQAQAGQQEAPKSTYLTQTGDVFSRYLKQYNALLADAREASERRITDIYNRRSRDRDRGIARTGERMLNQWPRSVSSGLPSMLKELFEGMGLAVMRVERMEHDQHYMVKFQPKGREVNYPHPIGAYGTVMQRNGLHVFLTFGKRNDNAMNAELQRIMSLPLGEQEPAIVLADSAITLPERRSLAHKLKSQSKASPYLLLDRVLLFYLAEFRQEERWDVLLRCTLPFHAYNPYTESSTVELCPEMFIGRQQELNSIVDSGGANIVYGGRQLGKTALLQRARNLRNIREDGQWAFYLDIRNRSVPDTARLIYEMLLDDNFLSEPGGVEVENISWDQLTRKIIQRMNNTAQPVKSVLLLLDEADAFLQGCGESSCAYEPIVSLKRIQSRTNRFKFVLAGLHNVMRFNKKAAQNDDSPIPHLASITMRPLPFHEARELIELPLSYLGFKVTPENDYLIVQILSSTNYFPGLIQYYCSSLVNTANQNFLGDANERPPYWLEETQILTLLKDKKFQENIKNKYEITLGVDEKEKGYYKTLAYALARCYFTQPENLALGYTADDIHALCRELDIHSVTELDREQVVELLDELIDLNVLRGRTEGGETRYIFNRASFRHMLGGEQEVDDELEKIMEKEAAYV